MNLINIFNYNNLYSFLVLKKIIYNYINSTYYYNFYRCLFQFKNLNKLNIRILIYIKYLFSNSFFQDFFNIVRPSQYEYTVYFKIKFFFLYIKNCINTYRILFGYSLYNRTRTNSNSIKCNSFLFKSFLIKYIYKKYFINLPLKMRYIALYFEFFNKLWFFYWNSIWDLAQEKFSEFKKRRGKKLKIGLMYALSNRAFTFIPKKVKKNKKKIKIPENTFNIGFYFLFTKKLRKIILNYKKH